MPGATAGCALGATVQRGGRRLEMPLQAVQTDGGLVMRTLLDPCIVSSMLHLYAALAEKERRLISERTKAALAAKKAGAWHRPRDSTDLCWTSVEPGRARAGTSTVARKLTNYLLN
jgi:Resolvase, N terminal domain